MREMHTFYDDVDSFFPSSVYEQVFDRKIRSELSFTKLFEMFDFFFIFMEICLLLYKTLENLKLD